MLRDIIIGIITILYSLCILGGEGDGSSGYGTGTHIHTPHSMIAQANYSLLTHFQTVNIANAYEDSRFDQLVDEGTNFKHSTVLCMPIKNSSGQIIGVIQVITILKLAFYVDSVLCIIHTNYCMFYS